MIDAIVEKVREKFYQRSQVGIAKYKSTLSDNNHDNYLKHLQEELMDATLYLEKLISLEKEITMLVKKHPSDSDLGMKIRKLVS